MGNNEAKKHIVKIKPAKGKKVTKGPATGGSCRPTDEV